MAELLAGLLRVGLAHGRASEESLDGASTTVTVHRVLGLNALSGEQKTHGQVPETLLTPPLGNLQQEEQYLYLGSGTLLLFLLAAGKATGKTKELGHQNVPLPITTSLEAPTLFPLRMKEKQLSLLPLRGAH